MATDVDYDNEPGTEDGQTDTGYRKQIRQLETKASKAEAAEARAEAAERKLKFAEAGINLSDPKMKYFIAGYDGELDAEKIKSAAEEAGFFATSPAQEDKPDVEDAADKADQEAFEKIDQATSGLGSDSKTDLVAGQREIYEKGGTTEDVARFLHQHGQPVSKEFEQ